MNEFETKMKELQQERSKKTRRIITICVVLFFSLGIIGAIVQDDNEGAVKVNKVPAASMAYIISQDCVKNKLKSPSTADFPFSDYKSEVDSNNYIIQSYVDSQNGFGATIRSDWQVKLKYIGGDQADPNSWQLIDVIIK